jgi:SAM-dependent methyltransferase
MINPTVYDDSITEDYVKLLSRDSPFHWLADVLERYVVSMLPTERHLSILDVPCGVGSFCRRVAELGYREITGVDLSPSQIRACAAYSQSETRVRFLEGDAGQLASMNQFVRRFDVVNASWLYDTARDENEALQMARNIHCCLKPGGRHQGLEINFGIHASHSSELECFGISLMSDRPAGTRPTNGERIKGDIAINTTQVMTTHVTYFDETMFTSLLRDAGFKNVMLYPPDTWHFGANWAASYQGKKFKHYIVTNPEMIAFSATA